MKNYRQGGSCQLYSQVFDLARNKREIRNKQVTNAFKWTTNLMPTCGCLLQKKNADS